MLQLFDQMLGNEASRMSRIADHNIYLRTDNLYEPLRNALRKSTVSPSFLSPQNHMGDNRLSASRIARNMRSLSPAETEIIKKNILIPVNKELVPTRNLQKVIGKQFIAVDMEEKVGEAISPEQFSRVKTGTVEEIVYQLKEDQPPSIYTYPRTSLPPPNRTQQFPVRSPPYSQVPIQQRLQHNTTVRQNQTAFQTPIFNSSAKQQASTSQLPTVRSATSEQLVREMPVRSILRESQENRGSGFGEGESKAYGFRQSGASKEGSLLRREREQYKYNLFSLIDEGGNNGCKNGCFGTNQILAPKITSNPWK